VVERMQGCRSTSAAPGGARGLGGGCTLHEWGKGVRTCRERGARAPPIIGSR
jgi:hypothetical protein